ncbi:MAG: hypothetical protein ABGX25_00070 [Nautiliaceae bacterium]
MKKVIDLLQKNGIICKKFEEIKLNTRKKIKAYLGVNLKNEYCFIAVFDKKGRFLIRDIQTLKEIMPQINFRYKKKILVLNGPICSKAKEELKEWRILWY